jgi:hypothetical protein
MITFESSANRRCYTSETWNNKEKFLRRTKPQDQPSTIEAGKAQSALIAQPSKSTSLTLMVACLWKIGRKILGLRNHNTGSEPSTPKKIITIREEATQVGDDAMGEANTNHCIACIMKGI